MMDPQDRKRADLADNSQSFSIYNPVEITPPPTKAGASSAVDNDDERMLGQFIPLVYHYNMLQDEARVTAFRDAINLLVKPGMHVVELGGGTGILSSFAARRGATVTCVERNPVLVEHARHFIKINELEAQINVVCQDAKKFVPERPVDVVVCEMLHVGFLREKQAEVIDTFKQNYLQRFAGNLPKFIPDTTILLSQPVEQDFDYFGFCAPVPLFQAPTLDQPRTAQIAVFSPYSYTSYSEAYPLVLQESKVFTAQRDGVVNAIRLATQNVVAIDEENQNSINWANQCLVVPLESPFQVSIGEPIELTFAYKSGCSVEEFLGRVQARNLNDLSQQRRAA